MVEGELDEREKVRPAIRGERDMARREDSDNMVFGGADAALRGKGTMIVGGNILIGKERRFKKGSQIIGGFVVKKEVGEGVEESFEERDNGGKSSDIGGGGAGFEGGKVDVPPVDNHQDVLVTLCRADGEATC
jgi:hypothetical protein